MADDRKRPRRIALIIAAVGIVLELIAIALLAAERIPVTVATPILIAGMFMAFVPAFVLSRQARRP